MKTMEKLRIEFPMKFVHRGGPESPALPEMQEGLRINAGDLKYDKGTLSFRLHVTCCLKRELNDSFRSVFRGVALTIEDASGGTAGAARLIDPHVTYPESDEPNYDPRRGKDARDAYVTRSMSTEVAVAIAPPTFDPSVFVTAVLLDRTSNTLAINLRRATFESLLEGKPSAIELGST
ncbi:MAG: hypothetical protein ACRELB_18790 [Polyangiaceae bacterium]